jgi:predicted transcriptional regulator
MQKLSIASALLALFLSTGCSTVSNYVQQYEGHQAQQSFNQSVEHSQSLVLEARALLYEGEEEKAKTLLDKAYIQFKDHTLLHETYGAYYEQTENTRLVAVSKRRANDLKIRSQQLNQKGRVAMVDYDSFFVAEDLFSLSLTYWAENANTLINMATLAYVTENTAMGLASIRQLNRIGHSSAEATMLSYLIYEMNGDVKKMAIAKVEMYTLYKGTPQYSVIHWASLNS